MVDIFETVLAPEIFLGIFSPHKSGAYSTYIRPAGQATNET